MQNVDTMRLRDLFAEEKETARGSHLAALTRLDESLRLIVKFIQQQKDVQEVTVSHIFDVVIYNQFGMLRAGIHGNPEARANVHLGTANLARIQERLEQLTGRTLVVTRFPVRTVKA